MPKQEVQQKQVVEGKKSGKPEKESKAQYLQEVGYNAINLQNRNPNVFVYAFNTQLSKESTRSIICSRCADAPQIQTRQQHEIVATSSNAMGVAPPPQRSQFQKNIISAMYDNNFPRLKSVLGKDALFLKLNKIRRETLENFWKWTRLQCSLYIENIVRQALVNALQCGMRPLTISAQVVERLTKISDPDTALQAVKDLSIPEPWQKDAADLLRLQASNQKSNWLRKKSSNLSDELYELHKEQLSKEEDCKNCESRQEALNTEYKLKTSNTAIASMPIVDWAFIPEVSAEGSQAALDYAGISHTNKPEHEIKPLGWKLLLFILNNMILKAEVSNEIRKGLIRFIKKRTQTPQIFLWNNTLRNAQNRRVTSLTWSLLAGPWGSWEGVYWQLLKALESEPRNLFSNSKLFDELYSVKRQLERGFLCGAPPEPSPSSLLAVAAVENGDEPRQRSVPKRSMWLKLWESRALKNEEQKPLLPVVGDNESQPGAYESLRVA